MTATMIPEDQVLSAMTELGLSTPEALRPGEDGYPRIVGAEVGQENKPFFIDMKLSVQWAEGGEPKPFIIRSNIGGDGAIALVVLDGKIALIRQWRVPLGRHTLEVTRGFSELWDSGQATTVDTLPKGLATAVREAKEELSSELGKVIPHYLGKIAENSGTHAGSPAYWLLELEGVTLEDNPNVTFVTFEEAIAGVEDSHSATALLLYYRRSLQCVS